MDKTLAAIALTLSIVGCKRSTDAPAAPDDDVRNHHADHRVGVAAGIGPVDRRAHRRPSPLPDQDRRHQPAAGSIAVLLSTDDAALAADSTANTVLLSMPVGVDDVSDLPSCRAG